MFLCTTNSLGFGVSLLWVQPSRQLSLTQMQVLAHSHLSEMGEKTGRVEVRKLVA